MSNEMPDLTPVFNNIEEKQENQEHTITIKVKSKNTIYPLKQSVEELLKRLQEFKAIDSYELN